MSGLSDTYFIETATENDTCCRCGKGINVGAEYFFSEDRGDTFCSKCCQLDYVHRQTGYDHD